MTLEEKIVQLTKETLVDLVNIRYDKLKEENKVNNETEEFLKEIISMQGTLTLPPNDEETPVILFCEAKTNAEKTEVTEFYFETIDA